MRFASVLVISGVLAKSLKPRRLNTEMMQFIDDSDDISKQQDVTDVQFMDETLFNNFDQETSEKLAKQTPIFEEQDGRGAMRNFAGEKGYKNHDVAADIAKEEKLKLPYDLEDFKPHQTTLAEEEKAGKPFIES